MGRMGFPIRYRGCSGENTPRVSPLVALNGGGGGRLIQHTSTGFMLSAGVSERGDPKSQLWYQGATQTLE